MVFGRLLSSRLRRPTYLAAGLGTAWALDHYAYDATFFRNIRTLYTGAIITIDYKWNFVPGNAESIEALHERVAKRILDVCKENGGLYIKFGQQIAAVPVLPPGYAKTFRVLFDDAPAVPYSMVEKIFMEEFDGKKPSDVFETFTRNAVASASIAQVHRATLKDGRTVAVKIQKPQIARQVGWDLWTYGVLCWAMEKMFDLPLTWSASYIKSHILQETDFVNEAQNAERAAAHIAAAPRGLGDRVHVPGIHWDLTSKRIMTAEWIDGVRFAETAELDRNGWSRKEIMNTVVDVFADQIFRSGFVHCDPHPGNILIRDHPRTLLGKKKPQIVLLDHGLYVQCADTFRHDYAMFWKSLFLGDTKTLKEIATNWGIHSVELFASSTLQKPWTPNKVIHVDPHINSMNELFEKQQKMKETVRNFLKDTELVPKELIFLGRNMNLVRANNKSLGSPVNRINIMANRAVQNLGDDWSVWGTSGGLRDKSRPPSSSIVSFVTSRLNYWTFRSTLFVTALAFHLSRAVQQLRYLFLGIRGSGFEDLLDNTMKKMAKEQFGLVVDDTVFEG
ncbi:ABC1 family-domain-containing protein [Phlyctochytrium arcticum]|nr:ABC1 family-domain-containing protein [Phlyctochytrium arcticum]